MPAPRFRAAGGEIALPVNDPGTKVSNFFAATA
jgi:hypothetical protein